MHRRKSLSVEETEERLAFALAGDGPRQAAHDFVASKLSDAGFRDKLDRYKQMIEQDDADLRNVSQQVKCLTRDWLLARLRRVHLQAMGEEPMAIGADGDEVYLQAPNFSAAIRSLAEIARVLRLAEEPVEEDDELSRALAELRGERAGKPVN